MGWGVRPLWMASESAQPSRLGLAKLRGFMERVHLPARRASQERAECRVEKNTPARLRNVSGETAHAVCMQMGPYKGMGSSSSLHFSFPHPLLLGKAFAGCEIGKIPPKVLLPVLVDWGAHLALGREGSPGVYSLGLRLETPIKLPGYGQDFFVF